MHTAKCRITELLRHGAALSNHLVLQMLEGHELQMWAGKIPARTRFLGSPPAARPPRTKPRWPRLLFPVQRCLFIPKNGSCSRHTITAGATGPATSCWRAELPPQQQQQKMKPPPDFRFEGKTEPDSRQSFCANPPASNKSSGN